MTDCVFQFEFQGKTYTATAYFSFNGEPYYIFVYCKDREFRVKFDEEITIKTDGEKLLPKDDDHIPHLLALRKAIFEALRTTPAFLKAKADRHKGIN